MKNTTDTFGNQNRDRPACSAVSQLYAPPRATNLVVYITKKYLPQAPFSRSAKVCRFSFSPSEFNACNKLPKTRVENPKEITSLKLKPSAGHQPYPVPFTSHRHNHFHNKCNQNISLPIFYVAHVVCIFLHSIFLITNEMHLLSSSCSGRIRFDSCSLSPQNEIGPSISSSVVLCVFVLLVYIVKCTY
jgi:hypothetical protein